MLQRPHKQDRGAPRLPRGGANERNITSQHNAVSGEGFPRAPLLVCLADLVSRSSVHYPAENLVNLYRRRA